MFIKALCHDSFELVLLWFFISLKELRIDSILSELLYQESSAFHYLKNNLCVGKEEAYTGSREWSEPMDTCIRGVKT